MSNLSDLMKCPECLIEGAFEIVIKKKRIEAVCENCDFYTRDRIPYPKHRSDHEGFQYHVRVGDVRPITAHKDDNVTCAQKEWERD